MEDKVIEGRGQPDLEVSESPGSQLFAQPDDGSLGNIAFFTEFFQGQVYHNPRIALDEIGNLFFRVS